MPAESPATDRLKISVVFLSLRSNAELYPSSKLHLMLILYIANMDIKQSLKRSPSNFVKYSP